ncbi:MAG: HisA/HisF-related TIM barrel protein [Gammaproteobacteria bacterium]
MIIYPDIEIKDGKTVNLTRGLENSPTVYEITPLEAARQFESEGAEWLHVIDIDGVFQGGRHNAELICEIIDQVKIPVQVGGGIRTVSAVDWWLDRGAARVVLGTAAVIDQHLVWEACGRHPGKIVVAVDAKDGLAMIDGWQTQTSFRALDLAKQFENSGVAAIIYTDINRFEEDPESSLAPTTEMGTELDIPVISTGTVRELDDISNLRLLPNIHGAIVGRALFNQTFTLKQAIDVAEEPGVDASIAAEGVARRHPDTAYLPVRHISCFSVNSTDTDLSATFYEKLNFTHHEKDVFGEIGTIELRHECGAGILLVPVKDKVTSPSHAFVGVNSIANTRDHLEFNHVKYDETHTNQGDLALSVEDPDGNIMRFFVEH